MMINASTKETELCAYLDLFLVLSTLVGEGFHELIVRALRVLKLHLALLDCTARGRQPTKLLTGAIGLLQHVLCFLVLQPQLCVQALDLGLDGPAGALVSVHVFLRCVDVCRAFSLNLLQLCKT